MKASLYAAVAALSSSISVSALAQDARPGASRVQGVAPSHALELSLAVGYSQGFGDIGKQQVASLTDLASTGGLLQVGIGYRFEPRLMVGVYAEGAGYDAGDRLPSSADVVGAGAGVQAQWHFAPYQQLDPWFGAGVGWHGYWIHQDGLGTRSLHGVDALRLQTGVDYRATPSLSLTPVLGFTSTTFLTEQAPRSNEWVEISNPRANVFVFAGLMGRFDIGGLERADSPHVASR